MGRRVSADGRHAVGTLRATKDMLFHKVHDEPSSSGPAERSGAAGKNSAAALGEPLNLTGLNTAPAQSPSRFLCALGDSADGT